MIRRDVVFCGLWIVNWCEKEVKVKQTYAELACDTEMRSRSNCSRRRLLCSSWRWRRTSVDMAGICVGGVVAVLADA